MHSENPHTSSEHELCLLSSCENHGEIDLLSCGVCVAKPILQPCMYEFGLEKKLCKNSWILIKGNII